MGSSRNSTGGDAIKLTARERARSRISDRRVTCRHARSRERRGLASGAGDYCVTSATELARRSLPDGVFGNGAGPEHHDVARPHVDLGHHLVGDLVLDATHFWPDPARRWTPPRRRTSRASGPRRAGRRRRSPAGLPDAARGALDVGRIDVAARHDDDVLDAAADHDVAVVHLVAQVAGVVPAVLVLGGQEAAHREVTGGQRLAAQFDDSDAAGRHHLTGVVDDTGLEVLQQRAERRQAPGVALGRRHGAANAASRSASTSSTTSPAPHSENDTASVVSAMP